MRVLRTCVWFLLLNCGAASAAQVKLAWNASPGSVAGYQISHGPSTGSYTATVDAGNATSFTVSGLNGSQTYFFAVKAYTTGMGAFSAFSNEVSAATVPDVSLDELRLSLPFTEGSGTIANDMSTFDNDADLLNGAAWGTGRPGGGGHLVLDGANDLAAVPGDGSLAFSGALTVAAWVRRGSEQAGFRMAVSRQQTTDGNDQFYLGFSGSQPLFGVDTATGGNQNTGSGSIPLDTWIHMAGVYDGAALKLYLDGELNASIAKTGTLRSSVRPILIGGGANGSDPLLANELFAGSVDDVRVYAVALSAAEIVAGLMPNDSATAITSPAAAATVSGITTVNASASTGDTGGVTKVEFYVDNVLKAADLASPYTFLWDTENSGEHACLGLHQHSLRSRVYDGVSARDSAIVTVNMNSPAYCPPAPPPQESGVLFSEPFEDMDFTARDWYDGTAVTLSTAEKHSGASSYECRFLTGARTCGTPKRRLFTATEGVVIDFWIKHASNFVGGSFGPHIIHVATNLDGAYIGPSESHMTTYIETLGGVPRFAIQDSKNIDNGCVLFNNDSFAGCAGNFGTWPFTEARSVGACNGLWGTVQGRDCYLVSEDPFVQYSSNRTWNAGASIWDNQWHHVEVTLTMNTIVGGIGQQNGVMEYKVDGVPAISFTNMLFRTGANPGMKWNQFLLAPYLSAGSSSADQSMWIDDLEVRGTVPVAPAPVLARPQNVRFN